jgi:hypothetical protein
MESATLTRPTSGPLPLARLAGLPWPAIALGVLILATLVGAIVYPTYPNYDSYYSLVWGRDLLHGQVPNFDDFRTPTQHPLAVLFGAALSLLGGGGDRVMVWCTLASFVVLCAGVYRLGRDLFTPLVGLAAAALLCTRFDFPSLAARAYIDIPYLALVIWAAVLEVQRPRRGGAVWVLLACAGLLRPEAWLLAGLYWLWMNARRDVPLSARLRWSVWTWAAPAIWVTSDFLVTGDPLFSQNHTSGLAEELGRSQGIDQIPSSMKAFFFSLAKQPVVYAALLGFALALWYAPKRLVMPVVLWLMGTGTFVMVGLAGLSVIDRYLLVPALMTMLLAAVAIAGWTMLRPGAVRTAWMGLAVLAVVYGVYFTAVKVNFGAFDRDLRLRGATHPALVEALRSPALEEGRRCGPVTSPSHKLVPEIRWVLGPDAGADDVLARSSMDEDAQQRRGAAIYVHGRQALLRQALVEDGDRVIDSIPRPGFQRRAVSDFYAVYVRC